MLPVVSRRTRVHGPVASVVDRGAVVTREEHTTDEPARVSVPAPGMRSWSQRVAPSLLWPTLIYGMSRVAVFVAAYAASLINRSYSTSFLLASRGDGGWYQRIITLGYETSVPPVHGPGAQTSIVFFPGFPLLARGLRWLTGLSPEWSAILVSLVFGWVATVLLWQLTRHLVDEAAAHRAAGLFVFFPAAAVLSMGYSESVFLVGAIGCMYALLQRRWLLAGLAGALASGTRITGYALVLCCALAAVQAVRARREWRALVAPAIAPLGTLGYFAYLQVHSGHWDNWFQTEQRGWDQRFDLGLTLLRRFPDLLHPGDHLQIVSTYLTLAFFLVVLVVLIRSDLPRLLSVYSVVVFAPAVTGTVLVGTHRYAMAAFPLFIVLARVVKGPAYTVVLATSATLMTTLFILGSLSRVYTV
jgi:hypothetical protein